MKLITELIVFALEHDMLTEENKQKLQDDGFYTFYYEESDDDFSEWDCWPDFEQEKKNAREDAWEDQLDRTFYGDFYHPGKHYGRRHHSGGGKVHKPKKTELELVDLEKRVLTSFKKWDKSLNPLVLTVAFLTNHGMNAQGRDLSTWQNASNWLFEARAQKLYDVVTQLDVTQILKFTQLCGRLTWQKLRELLGEPIHLCKGECVTSFKELIRGTNEPLSESAENMIQNEIYAQVYRLAAGWSKIC